MLSKNWDEKAGEEVVANVLCLKALGKSKTFSDKLKVNKIAIASEEIGNFKENYSLFDDVKIVFAKNIVLNTELDKLRKLKASNTKYL